MEFVSIESQTVYIKPSELSLVFMNCNTPEDLDTIMMFPSDDLYDGCITPDMIINQIIKEG